MDKNVTLVTSTTRSSTQSKAVGLWVVVRAADLKRVVDQVAGIALSRPAIKAAQADLESNADDVLRSLALVYQQQTWCDVFVATKERLIK